MNTFLEISRFMSAINDKLDLTELNLTVSTSGDLVFHLASEGKPKGVDATLHLKDFNDMPVGYDISQLVDPLVNSVKDELGLGAPQPPTPQFNIKESVFSE